MSSDVGPFRGGGSGSWFTSPFSSDLWDNSNAGDDDAAALAHANVDWRETHGAHIFRVDLPDSVLTAGVRKEDLKVEVEEGNILHISGNRVVEKVDENDKWHRVERSRGSFTRRFRLPENADVEGIKCGLEKKEVQEQPRNVTHVDIT